MCYLATLLLSGPGFFPPFFFLSLLKRRPKRVVRSCSTWPAASPVPAGRVCLRGPGAGRGQLPLCRSAARGRGGLLHSSGPRAALLLPAAQCWASRALRAGEIPDISSSLRQNTFFFLSNIKMLLLDWHSCWVDAGTRALENHSRTQSFPSCRSKIATLLNRPGNF